MTTEELKKEIKKPNAVFTIIDEFSGEKSQRTGIQKAIEHAYNIQGVLFLDDNFIKDFSC